MNLAEYVVDHTMRGECTCGQCVDRVANPQEHQPTGHTSDLFFFKVAACADPSRGELERLIRQELPYLLNGREHSYIESGRDLGSQELAMRLFGLANILGLGIVLTPNNVLKDLLNDEAKTKLAGAGMVTFQATL